MLLLSMQSAEGVNQFEPPSSSSKAPNLSLYPPLSTLPDNLEVFRVWMMKLGKPGVLILSQNCSESIRELDDGKICRNHIFLVKKLCFSMFLPDVGKEANPWSLHSVCLARVRLHRCWHPDSCPTHPPPPPRSQILQSRSEKTCGRSMLETTRWLKWCLMMMMMTVPCFFFRILELVGIRCHHSSQVWWSHIYSHPGTRAVCTNIYMLFTGHGHPQSNRHFPTFQPRLRCHDGRPWPARSYGSYGQWWRWHVSSLQTNNKEAKASRSGRP